MAAFDLIDTRLIEAVKANNSLWPDELYSGVMFWKGLRITRAEFERYVEVRRNGR